MAPETDKERILVVDGDPNMLELLRRNLSMQKDEALTASGVTEAIGILDKTPIDLVITDMKMPGRSGLNLIRHVRENCKNAEVMVVTGYATETVCAARPERRSIWSNHLPKMSFFRRCNAYLTKCKLVEPGKPIIRASAQAKAIWGSNFCRICVW